MDGDGDVSSSSSDVVVSSTVAYEEPRADPELPQPNASPQPTPTNLSPENILARMQLYDRTMLRHSRRVQLDNPNMEANEPFVVVFGHRDDRPGHGGGDADDAGAYDDDEYGGFVLGAVPASGAAIASLPETTVGEAEGEARDVGGERCAVCLGEYEAGDALRTMPCAHGFHARCIVRWLRASRVCPLCRFALPPVEDTETDDEEDDDEREAGHDDDERETAGHHHHDDDERDTGHDDDDALEYL